MMQSLEQHITAVLADPLALARTASQPVGFVGADLPPELALGTGQVFCHLPWRIAAATPFADRWLEDAFPAWARALLEDWAAGRFDLFAAVVFTRGDDAAQRLYYYICELQRLGHLAGPRPLMLDAATIPRESSVRHCRLALQRLLAELQLAADDLAAGIEAANLRRCWYQSLLAARSLPGSVMARLARATLFQDVYAAAAGLPLPAAAAGRTVLLAGSTPPDERLHLAVEAAGWNVGSELHAHALQRFGPPLEPGSDDPLLALARRLNVQPWAPRSFVDRVGLLEQELQRNRPQAALLWLTEEDESSAWDLARLRRVLAAHQVPALVLTRRRWALDDGAPDAVTHFLGEC